MKYFLGVIILINTLSFAKLNNIELNKPIKVALFDTGLDINDSRFSSHVCGAYDFTNSGTTEDQMGHGTHIAGLIMKYAGNKNYCFVVMKVFNSDTQTFEQANKAIGEAYKTLQEIKPAIVNFSGGGNSPVDNEEYTISILQNTRFIVAAGNHNEDIRTLSGIFYPASFNYSNITSVGALGMDGKKMGLSNFGRGVFFQPGELIDSTVPYSINPEGHAVMSGTSMATAIETGKFIYEHY